ncbi:MAG: hypothetical protein ABL957_03255 [Parvularculaceae bacterium]
MKASAHRVLAGLVTLLGACASDGGDAERWVAKGWLNPTPQGQAEIIGEFEDRADCEAAVDDWLQSQVVGNPIHAECLPV